MPLEFDVTPQTAYREAQGVVEKRKWQVVDEMPPEDGRVGYIDAVARSLIMGFRDDIVIRVRAGSNGGARVDVRSASRYGSIDFGVNAKRVTALLEDIDNAVSAAPPEPPPQAKPPPKPKPKPRPQRRTRRPHRTKR